MHDAFNKLYSGESLSDAEMAMLFISEDYVEYSQRDQSVELLYKPSSPIVGSVPSFISTGIEPELIEYIRRHPQAMFSMESRAFEELVATVFRNNGFDVELTPPTRDGGIDILAVRKDRLTGEGLHLIECKRYAPERKVGVGVVRGMLGVVEQYRATKGIIVTTSAFSSDALAFAAQSQYRLELSDYTALTRWLKQLIAS